MSIEIRELKITGFINKETRNKPKNDSISPEQLQNISRKIKSECVETVLEILERKNRR